MTNSWTTLTTDSRKSELQKDQNTVSDPNPKNLIGKRSENAQKESGNMRIARVFTLTRTLGYTFQQ